MSTDKSIPMKITTEDQLLGALDSNAAAAQREGAGWMLTEFVENGSDAIKINRENESKGGSNFSGVGKITIEIDNNNLEIRIIDNGTGILDPVWVIENPFKSKKKGVDYQIGNFGRGLTGFRGLCNTLVYITLRKKPESSENAIIQPNEDARCVSVSFSRKTAMGRYQVVNKKEFHKFCDYSTGTVAILKDWREGEWDNMMKNKSEIYNRMQHHFGHACIPEKFEISIIDGKEIKKVEPRDFAEFAKFNIPDTEVSNFFTKETYGKIEYHLYKTSPGHYEEYKSPYLLIKNRPLQNSFIFNMPEFKGDDLWQSKYITGYIICDFLEPNQLRVAIESGERKKCFVESLRDTSKDIKKMLDTYIEALTVHGREDEDEKIAQELQAYMRKLKIPIDMKSFKLFGKLKLGQDMGGNQSKRLSTIEGGVNEGMITESGTEQAIITYEKQEYTKSGKPLVPVVIPKKKNEKPTKGFREPVEDGKSEKVVWIDPNEVSKKGRKRKQIYSGPGLAPQFADKIKEFSWYEPSVQKVIINSGHEIYKKLDSQSKKSKSFYGGYSAKMRNYIAERYAWEVIMKFTPGKTREEKEKIFWEVFHNYNLDKSLV